MTRGPQCRITGKYQRCGNEAVDPIGDILLCETHLALAVELLRSRGVKVEPPAVVMHECCGKVGDAEHKNFCELFRWPAVA